MKSRWIACLGLTGLILCIATAAYAFEANFDPSTYNPDVGEIVNFEVCTSCLGGEAFTYSWDFDSDGVPEYETDQTLVTYSFASAGFYGVTLMVSDAGGRTSTIRKGIVVGSVPAYGVRELVTESDGAILVLITVTINERAPGIGIEEGIPAGWSVEVVDPNGALVNQNMELRQLEVAWMSLYEPGETVTFSYRLRPAYTTQLPALQGNVAGFFDSIEGRYVMGIAGELTLPR